MMRSRSEGKIIEESMDSGKGNMRCNLKLRVTVPSKAALMLVRRSVMSEVLQTYREENLQQLFGSIARA